MMQHDTEDSNQLEEKPTKDKDGSTGIEQHNANHDENQVTTSKKKDFKDPANYNIWERQSARVAKAPCTYFLVALIASLGLSVIAMVVGNFSVSAENDGWVSRGTMIANRQIQCQLIEWYQDALFDDSTGQVWEMLENTVVEEQFSDDDGGRRLSEVSMASLEEMSMFRHPISLPFVLQQDLRRRLEDASQESGLLEGCNTTWYSSPTLLDESHVWPVWKKKGDDGVLSSSILQQLCELEEETQKHLVQNGLCFGCEEGTSRCLLPYSLVLYARLTVTGGLSLTCAELASSWKEYEDQVSGSLDQCVKALENSYHPNKDGLNLPFSCPSAFFPSMVDQFFETTGVVEYSSSIFATRESDTEILHQQADSFARNSEAVSGAYDTQNEDFVNYELDSQLSKDMALALGGAIVSTVALIVHTRSPFLALIGLLQIILSFPLAYFVYTFIFRLEFFPFLNFIGIFVIFALGADDIFVAVDKWKNARLTRPRDTPATAIAAEAFPSAAIAMFLTSFTTAVAFFGTAVCPVAPIVCFSIFLGLLVIFEYLLCVLLIFPALCFYDGWSHRSNCCCHCHLCLCGRKRHDDEAFEEDQESSPSLIHRILHSFYNVFHRIRWIVLLVSLVALVVSAVFAAKIHLPTSSDVRLFDPEDNQYEQNYIWRQNILYDALLKKGGSTAYVVWGVTPADTGDHLDPTTFSQLVLDETFNPSKEDVQLYLRDFCDRFFDNDFASPVDVNYTCPINAFDEWLKDQSASSDPEQTYTDHCSGATSLPVAADQFDGCIYAWSQQYSVTSLLAKEGKVTIYFLPFNSRVRYDSPYDDLMDDWKAAEDWMDQDQENAPLGGNNAFFSSDDWWWMDTSGSMLWTAYSSVAMSLAAAALSILFTSRSLMLTVFAVVTMAFVLTSVTAILVGIGWTLGFLESILFAILIGVSCDFVIHFSNAYSELKGNRPRAERTEFALIHMGPSILAGALTTIAASLLMLFTVITFFQKFATVLLLTIVQSIVASFVVFLGLADTLGPSDPTRLMDRLVERCCRKTKGEEKDPFSMESRAEDAADSTTVEK